jgi:hypothetical protein
MKSNKGAPPKSVSRAGPAALLAAVAAVGLGLWQMQGAHMPWWPALGLLALAAVFGVVWLGRARAARGYFAVLDAYAERELAQARHRPHRSAAPGNRVSAKSLR